MSLSIEQFQGANLNDEEYNRVLRVILRWVSSLQDAPLWRGSESAAGGSSGVDGLGHHMGDGNCRHFQSLLLR